MSQHFGTVVVGMGIMGSASVWRLSQRGVDVLGLDAGAPINLLGSSHGGSRIFRQAYWEGLDYLPILKRADKGWRELQALSDRRLLNFTGGLFIGPVRSGVVRNSAATAKAGGVAHRQLTGHQVAEDFPAFNLLSDMEAVFEEGAYTIAADDARLEMLNQAVLHGAQLRFGCRLEKIERVADRLSLKLSDGQTIGADRVVLATGASLAGPLIPDLAGVVRPSSVPIYWFNYKSGQEREFTHFPAFLYELPDGRLLYGTPQIDPAEPGIKIGFHNHQQRELNVADQRLPVNKAFIDEIAECVASLFPGLSAQPYASRKCVYTMSPDESFLMGESKEFPGVYYVSACSGHGFKFAPEIGDYMRRAVLGEPFSEVAPLFAVERYKNSPRDRNVL